MVLRGRYRPGSGASPGISARATSTDPIPDTSGQPSLPARAAATRVVVVAVAVVVAGYGGDRPFRC